jgi:hypothetical protein
MLKALMIITMISGAEHVVKLPTMEQCMAESVPVKSQNDVASVACIPRTNEPSVKLPTEIFTQFMDMFMMMEEQRQWDKPCSKNFWKPGEDYHPPKP